MALANETILVLTITRDDASNTFTVSAEGDDGPAPWKVLIPFDDYDDERSDASRDKVACEAAIIVRNIMDSV